MKYGLQEIKTGVILQTFESMRDFLNQYPKGLDEDNRKVYQIVKL